MGDRASRARKTGRKEAGCSGFMLILLSRPVGDAVPSAGAPARPYWTQELSIWFRDYLSPPTGLGRGVAMTKLRRALAGACFSSTTPSRSGAILRAGVAGPATAITVASVKATYIKAT